jgi:hypothetical protein
MLGPVFLFIYLISTFIPLEVDNFGDRFDLFLFVTEKKNTKQTISRCQEDKNVTQETIQKLINHTHVHSRHRHVYCDVIDECGFTQSL